MRANMRTRITRGAAISTSGRLFNSWLDKSRADLALLTTRSAYGTAMPLMRGIPWFATQFGRDAIITALQMLWVDPGLAAGVLAFLALHAGAGGLDLPGLPARQDHA